VHAPAGRGRGSQAQRGHVDGRASRALTAHFWPFFPKLCAQAHREGWVPLLAIRKGHGTALRRRQKGVTSRTGRLHDGGGSISPGQAWDRRKFQAPRKSIC